MIDLAESARHTKLLLRFWLPVGRPIIKLVLWLLGPLRVRGGYRVPKTGGVLVVSNHISDLDPIVVQSACLRPLHFMAKIDLFAIPVIGRLQRAFGAFPVNRGAPDRAALRLAASLLRDGEGVGIFPEGQLAEDGNLQPIKPGVALIIKQAPGASVICCGLRGTNRIVPYGKKIPRPAFGGVELVWGEPRTFDKASSNEEILGWIEGQLGSLTHD